MGSELPFSAPQNSERP